MLRNRSGVCKGFGSMDSGQGERRGAEGSAAWTANGEGELYGVQDREQRVGTGVGDVRGSALWTVGYRDTVSGLCTGYSTVDCGQGTGELLRVQYHGQRAGTGSCTGFSTVDSDLGTGGVWGSAPWKACWIAVGNNGAQRCTGFSIVHSGQGTGGEWSSALWRADSGQEPYGVQQHG